MYPTSISLAPTSLELQTCAKLHMWHVNLDDFMHLKSSHTKSSFFLLPSSLNFLLIFVFAKSTIFFNAIIQSRKLRLFSSLLPSLSWNPLNSIPFTTLALVSHLHLYDHWLVPAHVFCLDHCRLLALPPLPASSLIFHHLCQSGFSTIQVRCFALFTSKTPSSG